MNYRYVPDPNRALRALFETNPAASLHEIRRDHPALRSMSFDHLWLRLAQLDHRPGPL